MWQSLPLFGTTVLLAVMVVAAYTFAVSLLAGVNGRYTTLRAARLGAYGVVGLIGVAVLTLAYAFVSHDFRLRYVAHYSDRSMSLGYLLTSLWGGQDGSLLWWMFLLALYVGVCVWTLGDKHRKLQPYIIATQMGVFLFFAVLMAFAANPFSTSLGGAVQDGEGLNPLLQNFYMIIHPPSLYTGFVGCTIPFSFAIAALVTGRLDEEWIRASRKFTLFAVMFLAIGNTLGMLWAYEELGWGGYWAWDPVENAAFMPLLSLAAFVHSVMIQERRGLLKVWNVSLICLTFFMTIFGTFLTRAGLISSVHSFAQSGIGTYFAWFMVFLVSFCVTLIMLRWPELRGYEPSAKLRRAALATGWFAILAGGPGAVWVASRSPVSPVVTFAVLEGLVVFAAVELVHRRLAPKTRRDPRAGRIESIWSREFTFLLNNWGLLGLMFFILVATIFPRVSEALWNEQVTVGPPYYNAWVQPLALSIYFLMGFGTLLGWKKTSTEALKRAMVVPFGALALTAVLHFALGGKFGYPAIAWSEPVYGGFMGTALRGFNAVTPVLGTSLSAFNLAVIAQEFWLLYSTRFRTGAEKTPKLLFWLGFLPGFVVSLISLPPASRRRYGGYVVHLGIVLMFFGFTGKSWTIDKETALAPGQRFTVDTVEIEYVGPRMEVDASKREIHADVNVWEHGKLKGTLSPAKFIYKKMPESPTTEVAMLHTVRDDLYLVVGAINPETKVATFQIHVNPMVGWIWLGAIVLVFGCFVTMWPEAIADESRVTRFARGVAGATAASTLGIMLVLAPVSAHAQQPGAGASSLHAGTVHIENPAEKELFSALRCMCGGCARDLLSTCACATADESRALLRAKLVGGTPMSAIIEEYAKEYGTASLAIPPNSGALRSIYVVPLVVLGAAAVGLGLVLKRWRSRETDLVTEAGRAAPAGKSSPAGATDDYDARIDEELRDIDA